MRVARFEPPNCLAICSSVIVFSSAECELFASESILVCLKHSFVSFPVMEVTICTSDL